MAERKQREGSLTEFEVGIVRNLLARGDYQNQDIIGLINTVRRLEGKADANGGRISDVKMEKPRYNGIVALTDAETDEFISRAKKPAPFIKVDIDPFNKESLRKLFPYNKSNNSLDITETNQIECKKSFGEKHLISNCVKAIAAFSNNQGGYIAFGIEDNSWNVVGINEDAFRKLDRKNLNSALRTLLSCGIDFSTTIVKLGKLSVGLMYIQPAIIKPVMFIKQDTTIGAAEGHIYYRYQAENRLIGPMELQQIIEERMRSLTETILAKHVKNIMKFGIENSAVMNLTSGEVEGKSGNFLIDEELLPKLSFVKEGEFVEKAGAPALKLIGDLSGVTKVVEEKPVKLTDQYPLSYTDFTKKIKKELPTVKENEIQKAVKKLKIKENLKYSAYNFRNQNQEAEYKKSGKLPSSIPTIYNDDAVKFVVSHLSS